MPNVGGKKFPYTQQGKKQAKRYAKKTGQSIENRGGSRMMRNPGMAPRPRRGAGPGARKMRPPVGPGMGGGGPRPLSRPSNAINRRRRRIGMGDPTVRPAANRRRRNY